MNARWGALSAWSALTLLFFWGAEALFVLFAWQNRGAPQTNFLAAVLLLGFWTLVSVAMTLRLYRKVVGLGRSG